MTNTQYVRRWAKKTDSNVESVKYFSYEKNNEDGSKTTVKEVTRPTYMAEDGRAFPASGEGKNRIVYFVEEPVPVIEEEESS